MAKGNNVRSQIATGASANIKDRQLQIEQLYFQQYQTLKATAYETYPELLVFDAEKIMVALNGKLRRYGGSPDEVPFLKFAQRFVEKEAQRYAMTHRLLLEYGRLIRSFIRKELGRTVRDFSVDTDSIFWEVVPLIFDRAHSLARPSKAKTSTRLIALVKKHIWFYHTSYWDRRHLKCEKNLLSFGDVETVSDEMLAAERASEKDSYPLAEAA